jgi:glutamate-1-semialdehyde 2,1-aminomutase
MTTIDGPRIDDLVADLFSQQWVLDLVNELTERQRKSTEMAGQVRELAVSSHVFLPFHAPPFPLVVAEASGCRLTDIDGNTYLDSHLGFGSQSLWGHNPPKVTEFVREQLGTTTGNGYLNPLELRLADLMRGFVPHCEKFAFLHSGTAVTNAAIRLARSHTGRTLVAKFEGCWHGMHDLAAYNTSFFAHGYPSVNPFPAIDKDGIKPIPAFSGVGRTDLLVLPHDIPAALELIERHKGELACVIADPVCQSFPFTEHTIPEVKAVSERCREAGVPFILDEVLTGFRFGTAGAAGQFGIQADLYCYGKVVAGLGISHAVLGGRAELMDYMLTTGSPQTDIGHKTFLSNTHAGNHLALAASYGTLSLLRDAGQPFYDRTQAKLDRFQSRLAEFRTATGIPLRLGGFGLYAGSFGFYAKDSYDVYREFAGAINPVALFLLTLLLRRRGVYTLSVPMFYTGDAHSEADMDELYTALTESALEMDKHNVPFVLS